MANEAACIVTIPSNSEALRFELEFLMQNGLGTKLFVFTPTYIKHRNGPKSLGKLGRWLWVFEPVSWKEFYQEMTSIGYKIQKEEPPKGTVLAFDKTGKQQMLITEATRPYQFVEAVKQHLITSGQIDPKVTSDG